MKIAFSRILFAPLHSFRDRKMFATTCRQNKYQNEKSIAVHGARRTANEEKEEMLYLFTNDLSYVYLIACLEQSAKITLPQTNLKSYTFGDHSSSECNGSWCCYSIVSNVRWSRRVEKSTAAATFCASIGCGVVHTFPPHRKKLGSARH